MGVFNGYSLVVKKINRSLKEINRLLSKGMSNMYLKVTIEKKLTLSKLRFSRLKKILQVSFCGARTYADM